MITNTNLAYISGYIDGDGCFYIGKTTNKKTGRVRYQSMIVISSTNKETLKYFAKQYSGTYRMSDNRINYPGQKIQYQFIIKGKKALQFAKDILMYLVEKIYQAKRFIDFMEAEHNHTKDSHINLCIDLNTNFISFLSMIKTDSKEKLSSRMLMNSIMLILLALLMQNAA